MGSWAELKVGCFPFLDTKGDVYPVAMTVFQEGDRKSRRRQRRGEYEVTTYEYRTNVDTLKKRLGIMGFSLANTEADFCAAKSAEEGNLEEYIQGPYEDDDANNGGQESPALTAESGLISQSEEIALKTLRSATFRTYLDGFKEIYQHRLKHPMPAEDMRGLSSFGKFMISSKGDYDSPEYWFPCSDWRFLLRAFIEFLPDPLPVVYDVCELVSAGYYEFGAAICRMAREALTRDYPWNEKIVVLTEGSTDTAILEASVGLLYKDLHDYYSFMDFGLSRAAGGAATLVQTVKAFIGSGIPNRIVALFDNDTAGNEALQVLSGIDLPLNVRAMTYPPIQLAKKYPTLGPSGPRRLDVNGSACSIELYLGRDVLASNGNLAPVQWTGLNNKLGRYQGEVVGKSELHKRFWTKVKRCRGRRPKVREPGWVEMKVLLEGLFSAFQ